MNIGILGGGQLARMMIESSLRYAFKFIVFSTEKNSPAGEIAHKEFFGDWNNKKHLKEFASLCDVITLENEFIDYTSIEYLEKFKPVYPGSQIVKMIQDKLVQKTTLRNLKIPVADFLEVNTIEDLNNGVKQFGYPVVLKSRTMGYDGKGNYLIKKKSDIEKAFHLLSQRGKLFCEKFVEFKKELAVQVVRNISGEIKYYPVVDTVQKNHICHLVIANKNFSKAIIDKVDSISKTLLKNLNYTGVLAIELFLTKDNKILVNELAPRVHNTGHYTIEGTKTSQFENHIRAILNIPLGNTDLNFNSSVMINILGTRNGKSEPQGIDILAKYPGVYLHLYDKTETRTGRKMGHITVTGDRNQEVLNSAIKAHSKIKI